MSTVINVMWYAAKLKALRKAVKVARDPYAMPEDERVALLRNVRNELARVALKMRQDIEQWDKEEREHND